jgi:hypothetical protein
VLSGGVTKTESCAGGGGSGLVFKGLGFFGVGDGAGGGTGSRPSGVCRAWLVSQRASTTTTMKIKLKRLFNTLTPHEPATPRHAGQSMPRQRVLLTLVAAVALTSRAQRKPVFE